MKYSIHVDTTCGSSNEKRSVCLTKGQYIRLRNLLGFRGKGPKPSEQMSLAYHVEVINHSIIDKEKPYTVYFTPVEPVLNIMKQLKKEY